MTDFQLNFSGDELNEAVQKVQELPVGPTDRDLSNLSGAGKQVVRTLAAPSVTMLASEGTFSLKDNHVYTIAPEGEVTFVLPEAVQRDTFHQILVQVKLTGAQTINVGTDHFFNKKAPDFSKEAVLDLFWEYDFFNNCWVCGYSEKGTV